LEFVGFANPELRFAALRALFRRAFGTLSADAKRMPTLDGKISIRAFLLVMILLLLLIAFCCPEGV
jgi:hypothetical protein